MLRIDILPSETEHGVKVSQAMERNFTLEKTMPDNIHQNPPAEEQKLEKKLLLMAKARVEFKQHLMSYLVINAALWAINYFSQSGSGSIYWWAVWPTLGWGVGLAFHFIFTYIVDEGTMVEREYNRLRQRLDRDRRE